ncbi:MAG: AcrB/AcrD/AcrF family protein [Actinobacteria bacterium]|nr:AcrB/AcrD/AcrF family protein [Actinomycetota bacterium]
MILSNAALNNRTTIMVLIVLIVAAGSYSYVTLPREAFPDVEVPYIVVNTSYEGVSPEDIESQITNEIENELMGMKGVKEITSISEEGQSSITIEFFPNEDIDDALRRVKDKVDIAKAQLPVDEQRKEPTVSEINIAEFPIMMINISGEVSPVALKNIAEQLEDQIKTVPGVLAVDVIGALEREIRIEIDADKVAAYGLTIDEIVSLIPSENVNISAGGLETEDTKFNVRVPAEFKDPEKIQKLKLTSRNGMPIYLTDVATVRDTFKDRMSYARLDGTESITVAVKKRVGANIVHIAGYVKVILDEFRKAAPTTVRFELTLDQSKETEMMVKDLENNVLTGLILVVMVLVLFMGLRTSIIVGLAIPLSMLMSFALLQGLGYTLNMVVLFSLILALGMLVDNAIVIVENIYRHMEMGLGRIEAAKKGTAQVAWPVITSTATTIAAFSPLLFWPGIMGEFMKYLPITLIITLSSSLFVAMIISPVVASLFSGGANHKKTEGSFVRGYGRLLRTALHHRLTTISLVVLLLIGIVLFYKKYGAGTELFPDADPLRAMVSLRGPQGMNIRNMNKLARQVEKRIDKFRIDPSGSKIIDNVVTNVGSANGGGTLFGGGSSSGSHMAKLTVEFVDYNDRATPSAQTIERIRQELIDLPGVEVNVQKEKDGPPTGAPVTVRIIGEDMQVLTRLSEKAKNLIADVPNIVNLSSDLETARPELRFDVDRERAKTLELNSAIIGNFLKVCIFGAKVGTFREFTDDYDITIRLPESQRVNIDDMLRLRVPNNTGKPVPLSSLGKFRYSPGLGTIHRIDQKRVVTLTADAEGRRGEEVLKDVQARLDKLELPSGYEIRYAGEKEHEEESTAFLSKAFLIAILLIVAILVTQFNTLSVPLIIMTTVGLSTIGVFAGLLIFDMPFGIIMTGVGVISLAGVVVNNAIVLLDYTRKLQRRGLEVSEAAVQAGKTRLRPVLLTAVTTILGLIPMATGISFDFHIMKLVTRSETSQWWASMAIAVIFGLSFATILTLVIVPSLYVSLYRVAAKFHLGGLHTSAEAEDVTG